VLIHFRGTPNVGDVFGFAAGALAGFTLIGLVVHSRLRATEEAHSPTELVLTGVLHWFAIGTALGAVALIAQIPSWVAWPLAMFAATTVYLRGASLQLAAVRASSPPSGRRNSSTWRCFPEQTTRIAAFNLMVRLRFDAVLDDLERHLPLKKAFVRTDRGPAGSHKESCRRISE